MTDSLAQQDQERESILQHLEKFMESAQRSHELLNDHSILDSLGTAIKKWQKAPLEAISEAYLEFDIVLADVIKDFVSANVYNLQTTKDLYVQQEGRLKLHFYIIVDKDNIDVRDPYYEFIDEMDGIPIMSKFILSFHFLTPEFIPKLNKKETDHLEPKKV